MIRKLSLLSITLAMFFCMSFIAEAANVRVGGHVKLSVYDQIWGERTSNNDSINESDIQYTGFNFGELVLYVSGELSEKLSYEFQPSWMSSTGATPSFGKNIGDQKKSTSDSDIEFHGLIKGVVKYAAPHKFEISAGIVKPKFTADYGAELFWEDQFHGGKFSTNNYLGAMHDTGIEIYRSFEVGQLSLPVYLYLLNGGNGSTEFVDNNKRPMGMIHIEPEFGAIKLLGSFAYGHYIDEDRVMRWSGGLSFNLKGLMFRGEYAGGQWDRSISNADGTLSDAKPWGFYAKLGYKVKPWLNIMFSVDYAKHNFGGFFYTGAGYEETYITYTPIVRFSLSDSTYLFVQWTIADWQKKDTEGTDKDVVEKLQFNRVTCAVRSTF